MLTIFSVIGVGVTCVGFMSAVLLAEIPQIQAMGNNNDEKGLMLFAPLTKATGACFLGGALSSYECIVSGTPVPRNDGSHSEPAYHYTFDGKHMLLHCTSMSTHGYCYHMQSSDLTYIAWVKGSNVKLLELDRLYDKLTISISSGRLEFQSNRYSYTIANLQAQTLYKVAIVYNGTHVVANIDGNQTSLRIAGEQNMSDRSVLQLTVGEPLDLGTNTSRLSLFCLQVWIKALTATEISAAFRRCDKWRPLPVVTSSSTFAAYEKSLNRRCDQTSGAELTMTNRPQQVTPGNANNLATTEMTTPFATVSDCVCESTTKRLSFTLALLLSGAIIVHILHVLWLKRCYVNNMPEPEPDRLPVVSVS